MKPIHKCLWLEGRGSTFFVEFERDPHGFVGVSLELNQPHPGHVLNLETCVYSYDISNIDTH